MFVQGRVEIVVPGDQCGPQDAGAACGALQALTMMMRPPCLASAIFDLCYVALLCDSAFYTMLST